MTAVYTKVYKHIYFKKMQHTESVLTEQIMFYNFLR